MATKNPFGNLRIDRDDDEEVTQTVSKTVTAGTPLFAGNQNDQKKKKKVRPEEVKKEENYVVAETNNNEGFEVVGKVKTKPRSNFVDEEQTTEEKSRKVRPNKGAYIERNQKVNPGKRQFDRQSGTGRGREVAKNGAGSKTVWGDNPENVARSYKKEYNADDHYFDNALNPKPRRNRDEEVVVEAPKEETRVEVEETPVVEQTQQETPVAEETYEKKRKQHNTDEEPIKPEDLLERPENALSLAEYREQLKEKNRKILANAANKPVTREVTELKQLEKENFVVKTEKKERKRKQDNSVQEIAVTFKTSDSSRREVRNDDYANRKPKGLKFNVEDLPSL